MSEAPEGEALARWIVNASDEDFERYQAVQDWPIEADQKARQAGYEIPVDEMLWIEERLVSLLIAGG